MPIADKMVAMAEKFALVQDMFETGARLKAEHGADKVFDFSLGNPDVPAPSEFKTTLKALVNDTSLTHGYMSSQGYPHVRQAVADYLCKTHNVDLSPDLILMTVGAVGALNNALKALVNPGEEVLTPAPYFIGYTQYAFNAQATLVTVATDERFHLDLDAVQAALNRKTRVVLINSPNNPTGAVYTKPELKALGNLLEKASKEYGKRIYLLSDEPYRKITYDVTVPSVFQAYSHSLVANSYSKDLSLAGERIGYLAVHPEAEDARMIIMAATAANTSLYVNAPSLLQLSIANLQDTAVDVSRYRRRRDLICAGLAEAGYEFNIPEGAFYLFPKSPLDDELAFTRLLRDELILVSPGRGFGCPGYFRISYAVPSTVISGAMAGFKRAMDRARC